MPPSTLKQSVLVTLGLALGACGDKEDDTSTTYVGPCLSAFDDSGGGGEDSGGEDSGGEDSGGEDSGRTDSREQVTRRVIDAGILPEDVAKMLAKRMKDT